MRILLGQKQHSQSYCPLCVVCPPSEKQLSSDLNELGEHVDNEDLIEASQRPHLILTDSEIRAQFPPS